MVQFHLNHFESIGDVNAEILKKAGIHTVDDFLKIGKETLKQEVSTRFNNQISVDDIEKWGEIFDLFRIPKITPRVAEWLVNADINSVEELSHRDAMDIFYKLKTLDEKTYFIILNLPTLSQIDEWITFAKLMVRPIKFGSDIPLIRYFPLVTVDYASEFQMYHIWTVIDLQVGVQAIPDLWRLVGMKKQEFQELVDKASLTLVDGIDVDGSKLFYQAGIKSLDMLREIDESDLVTKVTRYQAGHEKENFEIYTKESIRLIKQNAMAEEIIPIQWGRK